MIYDGFFKKNYLVQKIREENMPTANVWAPFAVSAPFSQYHSVLKALCSSQESFRSCLRVFLHSFLQKSSSSEMLSSSTCLTVHINWHFNLDVGWPLYIALYFLFSIWALNDFKAFFHYLLWVSIPNSKENLLFLFTALHLHYFMSIYEAAKETGFY